MEITNNSRNYSIPLVVGRRIAQIVFFDSDGTLTTLDKTDQKDENEQKEQTQQSNQIIQSDLTSYEKSGKYQTSSDLNTLMKQWKPEAMLPKMYEDREININIFKKL